MQKSDKVFRWRKAQQKEVVDWVIKSKMTNSPEMGRWQTYFSRFKEYMVVNDGDVVLDLGCGPDGILFHLPKSAVKIGVDPLMDEYVHNYDIARKAFLIKAVGERMPIRDKSVDCLICINALDHTIEPKIVIEELHRILQPGGRLLLDIHTTPPLDRLLIKVGYRPPLDEYHPVKLLAKDVITGFEMSGFKIIRKHLSPPLSLDLFVYLVRSLRSRPKGKIKDFNQSTPKHSSRYLYPLIRFIDLIFYPFFKDRFAGRTILLLSKVKLRD